MATHAANGILFPLAPRSGRNASAPMPAWLANTMACMATCDCASAHRHTQKDDLAQPLLTAAVVANKAWTPPGGFYAHASCRVASTWHAATWLHAHTMRYGSGEGFMRRARGLCALRGVAWWQPRPVAAPSGGATTRNTLRGSTARTSTRMSGWRGIWGQPASAPPAFSGEWPIPRCRLQDVRVALADLAMAIMTVFAAAVADTPYHA